MTTKGPIGIAQQLNYLIQWFLEYSEMQKEDFLAVLLETYSPDNVNGVSDSLNSLHVNERPPSIFQCRMKLFREWFLSWSDEEKSEFLAQLERLDENFVEKFREVLSCKIQQ